jgi:predicted MFS family arabinose efflux permease
MPVEPTSPSEPGSRTVLTTVAALGVSQVVAFGTSFYLLTVLGEPIGAQMGWPQSWVVGGFTIGVLAAAGVARAAGRFVAQGFGREILTLSALCFCGGLTTIGLSNDYPIYVIGWLLLGIGMGGGLYDITFGTIGRCFGAKSRTAITQVALIGGFSSAVFWPLTGLLLAEFGWRNTCLAYAALNLIMSAPLYWWFAPRPHDTRDSVKSRGDHQLALNSADRPAYFALAFLVVAEMAINVCVSVYLLQMLTEHGAQPAEALALSALVGPAQIAMRLIELAFGNRLHPRHSMAIGVAFVALALVMLAFGNFWLGVPLLLYGGGKGVISIARGTLPLALFGPVRSPVLMGNISSISLVAQAGAPVLLALVIDRHGLDTGLWIITALAVISCGVSISLVLGARKLAESD